jgi:sarcosine oxidase
MLGKPDSEVIKGTLSSIREHSLPHQFLTSEEVMSRYPAFHLQADEIGVYEDNAGYLHPELCIESYVHMAKKHGAVANYGEKMLYYEQSAGETDIMRVKTDRTEYTCNKLILTVGAWAPQVYGNTIGIPLQIERGVVFWYDRSPVQSSLVDYPVYIWDCGDKGGIYGFPEQPAGYGSAIKVGMHFGKTQANLDQVKTLRKCTTKSIVREVKDFEKVAMKELLCELFPSFADSELIDSSTCLFTMTSDMNL